MRYIVAVLCVVLLSACGDDGPTSPPPVSPIEAAAGTYTLESVNGQLPYLFESNDMGMSVYLSGSLSLRASGGFTETITVRTLHNGSGSTSTDNITYQGTFDVVGSQITFTIPATQSTSSYSWTGAISGGVVAYTIDGESFRYQR